MEQNHHHTMRRKDRQINDLDTILQIVRENNRAVISMIDGDAPYGVMMNYSPVMDENKQLKLVFHGARAGRKISCLKNNPKVSLFINDAKRTKVDTSNPNPAEWTTYYRSVIIQGTVVFTETIPEKQQAMTEFLAHYSDQNITIPEPALRATELFYVVVQEFTGKESKNPHTQQD